MRETQTATALTTAESAQLAACETIIGRGIQSFFDVGNALQRVRDCQLFRARYKSFADYCEERWQISRSRAYQLMESAAVVSTMVDRNPDLPAVSNERQARALSKVPESERADTWRDAVAQSDGKPTANAVKDAQERRCATPMPAMNVDAPTSPTATSEPTGAREPSAPSTDNRAWRARLFAELTRAGSQIASYPVADIIARADEETIAELGRLANTLTEKHAAVIAARPRHLRAV